MYEKYDEIADIWGDPQVYKGITFYPIRIKNYQLQRVMYEMLGYPKNYIADYAILKLSYLKFLLYVIQSALHKDTIREELIDFLKLMTQSQEVDIIISVDSSKIDNFDINDLLLTTVINGVEFTEDQFEIIREIILRQNGIDVNYIEEYNPDLEEKLKFINRNNNLSTSDEIFTFCSMMRKTVDEIGDYTIFQFKNHMERLFLMIDFELFKPLEMSGQISLKDGKKGEIIKHYLSHVSQSTHRYDAILISKDKYVAESDIFKASSK